MTLLEATRKKCDFLEHVIGVLRLKHARVIWGRAETVAHEDGEREQYDLVVARAVAELATLAEYMLPFVKPQGLCVAWKGEQIETELDAARDVYGQLGGRLREVRAVQVPGIERRHHLVVMEKVSRTPKTYPRRSSRRPTIRFPTTASSCSRPEGGSCPTTWRSTSRASCGICWPTAAENLTSVRRSARSWPGRMPPRRTRTMWRHRWKVAI